MFACFYHQVSAQPEAATKTNRKDAKGAKSMLDTDLTRSSRLGGHGLLPPQRGAPRFAGLGFLPNARRQARLAGQIFPLSGIAFACERWAKTAAKVRALRQPPSSSHEGGFVKFV